jgi:hypothetical protein
MLSFLVKENMCRRGESTANKNKTTTMSADEPKLKTAKKMKRVR